MTTTSYSYHPAETILDDISSSILRTLLYFDIFRHPLTKHELWLLSERPDLAESDMDACAQSLVQSGLVQESEGFYFLHGNMSIVQERRTKNARAQHYHAPAAFFSRIIDCFPFTRAVFLSGSLSKGCMDASSDIDYFIITEPGRLWLNRTLLVLFKKLVLLNSYKFFCVNYSISSDNLEIPERNIYTAIEIAFLMPIRNSYLYESFMEHNAWVASYLPHFPLRDTSHVPLRQTNRFKRGLERLLSGSFGDRLEEFCFRITVRNRRKKFAYLSDEEFSTAMRSTKNVAKHHPQNFQERVLTTLEAKCAAFEHTHNVRLT